MAKAIAERATRGQRPGIAFPRVDEGGEVGGKEVDEAASGKGAGTGVGSAHVKAILVALACALAGTLAGCGGGDDGDAAPLTLEQRILRKSDAPGSKADPVERGATFRSVEEAVADPGSIAAHIGRAKLEEIGFVAAIEDVRFWPTRPDGRHTPDAPHVRMLVVEARDEERAQEAVEVLRAEALEPCPGVCAIRWAEFKPSSVPDAQGLHTFALTEDIERLGEEGKPFDSFTLWFADGPFAYELVVFGDRRGGVAVVSREELEEIAERVHRRVEGAPSPG